MSRIMRLLFLGLLMTFVINTDVNGRGFGGGRGGGMRSGGYGGGVRGGGYRGRVSTAPRDYRYTSSRPAISSRPAVTSRPSYSRPSASARTTFSSPRSSVSSAARTGNYGSRTYTGRNGGTVTIGGAAGRVDGARGSAGGAVGGTRITTPGGRTITRGRGISGATTGSGNIVSAGRGRTASGNSGSVTRGGRVTVGRSFATDNGFAKYSRGAAVRGANGGVAVGHRTHAVSGAHGQFHGATVRTNFHGHYHGHYHGCFGPGWHVHHPNAWRVAGWTAATYWTAATINSMYGWWGWGTPTAVATTPVYGAESPPAYYDYGSTVVYEGDQVYYGDKPVATAEQYYQDAAEIAQEGIEAEAASEEEWRSFGVFGMVQGDSTEANKILQLAANKTGVVRGTYFDAMTKTTLPIAGSVDKESKRVAWTVGDNKEVVYETGLANLGREETQMLVHYGKDRTQQWTLVRLEAPLL